MAKETSNFCRTIRRRLVKFSTLDLASGEMRLDREGWEESPCATPLFSDTERASGQCKACAGGWEVETNYPVTAGEDS